MIQLQKRRFPLEANAVTRLAMQTSNKRYARSDYPVEGRAQLHTVVIRSTAFHGMVTLPAIAREWRLLIVANLEGLKRDFQSPCLMATRPHAGNSVELGSQGVVRRVLEGF